MRNIPHLDSKIDDIIERFDFNKVLKAMNVLNWVWVHPDEGGSRVPNLERLKATARYLIYEAVSNDEFGGSCSTGGFHAKVHKDNTITLSFVLAEFTTPNYDADRSNFTPKEGITNRQ